jgi:hypothetical protein
MKRVSEVEKMVRSLRDPAEAGTHDQILNHLLDILRQRQKHPAGEGPTLRRAIMKNPITRLAAAAVFIGGMSLFIGLLVHTTTPAYALDQTVTANQQLRSLHLTEFVAGHEEPKEFWLERDEAGQIKNARWHMPTWDAPQDGAKVVVWSGDKIRVWFKKKGALTTFSQQNPPDWLQGIVRTANPELAIAQLKDRQAQGEVELQIQEPADKAQPIVVTATYLPQSRAAGRRTVLCVDQKTKLVTTLETFALKDGQYVLDCRAQFTDYNVAFDPALFDLEATVPADVRRVDGDALERIGLPQGTLSDDEIATEVVRQFFEALIAQDYEKAGLLLSGTPAEKMKETFGKMRFLRIVSMGKPTPHPIPEIGGLRVPCKVEVERDDVKSIWEPYGPFVRPTHRKMENPRWAIFAGL